MRRHLSLAILLILCVVAGGCGGYPLTSVTKVTTPSRTFVDNTLLTQALEGSLGNDGKLDLTALRRDTSLTAYLRQVAEMRMEVFTSRLATLAFWINAHNAYMLDMLRLNIAERKRGLPSTTDVGRLSTAPAAIIGGDRYSLEDIRERIAKEYREPRAFFALWLGGRSSPRLWSDAYDEKRLSDQLNRAARTFLADTTKNRLDAANNRLLLSPIFSTYSEELQRISGSIVAFVRAFAPPKMAEHIDQHPAVSVQYMSFDNSIY